MQSKLIKRIILVVTITITIVMTCFVGFKKWAVHGDAFGYYLYLPATFIYHNHTHLDSLPADKGILIFAQKGVKALSAQRTPKGYPQNQYTYGVALMELPFFFAMQVYDKINGSPANGFSESCNYMLILSSLFYSCLGLFIVYRSLKRHFTDTQSLLGTCLLLLCTNLLYVSTIQGGMAHPILFFLYAALIYNTIKAHDLPETTYFILAGLIAGLITIIRPTDILCLLIPILYNVYNKESARKKVDFILVNKWNILVCSICFTIPIIPQMLYWHYVTGSYIYYSYGSQSFDFRHPKIIEGLFYFSNGWLPYSPIMILSIIGLFVYKPIQKWVWVIVAFFPVYVYIIYSWYCYNYINGLGSRPMINIYALLAFPLTAMIWYIAQRPLIIKVISFIFALFLIAVNISNCIQQANKMIISEESNMAFQLQMLFKTHLDYNDLVVRDVAEWQPDEKRLTKIEAIGEQRFEDSTSPDHIKDTVAGSTYVYQLGNKEHSSAIEVKYNREKFKDARWVKCSGKFMYTETDNFYKHLLVVSMGDKLWKACKIENKINGNDPDFYKKNHIDLMYSLFNKWGYIYYFIKIPSGLKEGDDIKMYVWNTGKQNIFIDDLCLELYK